MKWSPLWSRVQMDTITLCELRFSHMTNDNAKWLFTLPVTINHRPFRLTLNVKKNEWISCDRIFPFRANLVIASFGDNKWCRTAYNYVLVNSSLMRHFIAENEKWDEKYTAAENRFDDNQTECCPLCIHFNRWVCKWMRALTRECRPAILVLVHFRTVVDVESTPSTHQHITH